MPSILDDGVMIVEARGRRQGAETEPVAFTLRGRPSRLNMNFGTMRHGEAMRSLRLFGTEVMPAFRP